MSKNLEEARKCFRNMNWKPDDVGVICERIVTALDAAERRGFERCREMAAGVLNGHVQTQSDCQDFLPVVETIRALQYKEDPE